MAILLCMNVVKPTSHQIERQVFLQAEWRHLVMLNFTVPRELLEPLVPAGTVLDLWQGRAYVSVVGFLFLNTRVRGMRIPWHTNFEELNLRFYVRRDTKDGPRRGVVFVRELVPRRLIAWVAKYVYNENYAYARMSHDLTFDDDGRLTRASYAWRYRKAMQNSISVCIEQSWSTPAPGSEEEFITEHYWGYARQRDGSTMEYRVSHPAWRVAVCGLPGRMADWAGLYGEDFGSALSVSPVSAFVAEGSGVSVYRGVRIA